MPSPLGHALAGLAAGWMVVPPTREGEDVRSGLHGSKRTAIYFGLAGMAADLDFLIGMHRGPTHGLGAAVVAGLLMFSLTRRGALAVGFAAAYGSHTLLDWLSQDTSPPVGLMALWPLSREYYIAGLQVFQAISRRYWLAPFWVENLRAVARELLILVPIVVAVVFLRRRKPSLGSSVSPAAE